MADTDKTPPCLKTVKRPRYKQKFKLEYSREFKFILKSRASESYAFCTLCRSDNYFATLKTANRHVFCKYTVLTIS